MSQINKSQTCVERDDYFLQEIRALCWKQFFQKFCYIFATTKVGDDFAEMLVIFFMDSYSIRIFPVVRKGKCQFVNKF